MKRCKYYIEKDIININLSYVIVEDEKQIFHVYLNGTKLKGHFIGDIHYDWIRKYYREIPAAELALII